MFNAGAQVPVIPLVEVVGKAVKAAPEQIGATAAKVGVTVDTKLNVALEIQPLLSV